MESANTLNAKGLYTLTCLMTFPFTFFPPNIIFLQAKMAFYCTFVFELLKIRAIV